MEPEAPKIVVFYLPSCEYGMDVVFQPEVVNGIGPQKSTETQTQGRPVLSAHGEDVNLSGVILLKLF